ncbi:MAG: TMEM175 family protein [Terricaulis sp.]
MSHHESVAKGPDARLVDRMLFFSDAVFAIVLTLMVLELRPPEAHSEADLARGIAEMGRQFASFFISFALGAAFWLAHMRLTRSLLAFDWPTAFVNLIHLMCVALLPFAAAVLGEHIASDVAFSAYALVIIAVSFSGALFWLVASRGKGRLMGGLSWRQRIAGALRSSAIGWAFVAGFILTQQGQVEIARFCWLFLFPVLIVARVIGGAEKRPA